MDFAENIKELARSVPRRRKKVHTEEATKTSLIMPFIAALGYDIHEPDDIIPEFTADAGVKQNEKVDYAILKNGKPVILVECKSSRTSLRKEHLSQLIRYYAVTDARFAILTNGVEYQFFTDLRKRNVMDETPYMIVDMLDLKEWQVSEICKFAKPLFDGNAIWESVHSKEINQKDMHTITNNITREFETPSRDFVNLLAKGVLGKGRQKKAERERVKRLTKQALDQYLEKYSQATQRVNESSTSPPESGGNEDLSRTSPISPHPNGTPDFSVHKGWDRSDVELKNFFMKLHAHIVAFGKDVKVVAVENYISFKRKRNIADVKLRSRNKELTVYALLDPDSVQLQEGFTRDVRNIGHHSPNNLEITIRNQEDLEKAKPLLQQSYQKSG